MTKGFYLFSQNNSGGSFDVDEKVCHTVVIEAESADEANSLAKDIGVYFDGCYQGIDCDCCGDRWYEVSDPIDLERYKNEGYTVSMYERNNKTETEDRWNKKYSKYSLIGKPEWIKNYSIDSLNGKIRFHNIEEYLQFMANEYGSMFDELTRLYYSNGSIKEFKCAK